MEYNIRKPQSTDLFVACKILKGVGLKNIKDCFTSDAVKTIKDSVNKDNLDEVSNEAGLEIMLSLGDLILEKVDVIQDDLIKFISNLSGLKVKEVETLPIVDFANLVIEIFKTPDFVDFIKVVLKLSN